eukprot:476626_1
MAQKTNRKKRTVKNPLVNTEDITIEPGLNYVNWIPLIKTKLKEREINLTQIRVKLCEDSIMSSIHQFTLENLKVFKKQRKPPVHIQVGRMETDNLEAYENTIDKTTHNIINTFNFNESIRQELKIWKGYNPQNRNAKIQTFTDYYKGGRSWWDTRKTDIIGQHVLIPIAHMVNQFTQKAASEFFANLFWRLQKLYKTYLYTLIL